jgi:ankyrin repeat protein
MTSAWYPRAWLTERGFDPDGDLGTSTLPSVPKRAPLYQAAQAGELSVCKWLHDHGATTVVQSASIQRGDSPLMVACSQGHLDVAKWLFSHGAEEDATRESFWTSY